MSGFNYQDELEKIIKTKQLVEINIKGASTFEVTYILSANDEYLTFAEISLTGTLNGVTICLASDIESISVETMYLEEMTKIITNNLVYQQALDNIKNVKNFTFKGFVAAFENTKTVVEVSYGDGQNYVGRVVGLDEKSLVLDEFYVENDRRFARTYINPEIITSITVDAPRLRIVSRAAIDKNL